MPPLRATTSLASFLAASASPSFRLPPGYLQYPGNLGGILGGGIDPGIYGHLPFPLLPPPAPPPPPAGLPVNLRLLLGRVPIANEGNVITSEYHNTVRDVLLAMAQLFGAGVVSPAINVSFAPQFVGPTGEPAPAWSPTQTGVSQVGPPQEGKPDAFGWMSVQLPDGARIQSMTVFGNKAAATKTLTFSLLRYPLSDVSQTSTTLIKLDASDGTGGFSPSDSIKIDPNLLGTQQAALATLQDYQSIQNDKFKYIFTARLGGAPANAAVQINAIQMACSLGDITQ